MAAVMGFHLRATLRIASESEKRENDASEKGALKRTRRGSSCLLPDPRTFAWRAIPLLSLPSMWLTAGSLRRISAAFVRCLPHLALLSYDVLADNSLGILLHMQRRRQSESKQSSRVAS